MSFTKFTAALKGFIFNKPNPIDAKRAEENPYLAARRTWNEHVGSVVSQRQTWQVIGILALLITLSAVAGMIYIGSQSKFIPYVVQVDKLGQTLASGPVSATDKADPRVVHAALAEWTNCARLVTPDAALQRKCVFKVYSMLAPNDPATPKMNEWFNGTPESSPFKRAANEMAGIEIKTVIPQTPDTWQVEWVETTRDRQGVVKGQPVTWRTLITTYTAESTPQTTDEQLRNNPLGIYVRDFSWSRVN
ncbi:MAG: hypothetical protein RIR70_1752 [Pseudomonadota bacterium]|jgi:type IV secretion system protein VirB5